MNLTTVAKYGGAGGARRSWPSRPATAAPATSRPPGVPASTLSLLGHGAHRDHVDLRRLGRPRLHGRRGEGPAAHPPAGAHPRHRGDRVVYLAASTWPTSTWCRCREMAGAKLIAATAAERIPAARNARRRAVVAAIVMVSCFGALNGSMMTGPRIFFAMADRGLFFQAIARVSPRFQSPSVAIWLATALGIVYVLLNDFQQLADKFILGIWPFYALAVAAVFVLRRTPARHAAALPDVGLSGGAGPVPARFGRDGGERARGPTRGTPASPSPSSASESRPTLPGGPGPAGTGACRPRRREVLDLFRPGRILPAGMHLLHVPAAAPSHHIAPRPGIRRPAGLCSAGHFSISPGKESGL